MRVIAALVAVMVGLSGAPARLEADQAPLPGTPIVVEGIVAMAVEDDFARGRATRHYFLDQPGSGRRYDLRLTPRQAAVVQPGMRVRVTGGLADGVLTADQGELGVLVLGPPDAGAPGKNP